MIIRQKTQQKMKTQFTKKGATPPVTPPRGRFLPRGGGRGGGLPPPPGPGWPYTTVPNGSIRPYTKAYFNKQ